MRHLILALTMSVAITLPAHACEQNDVSMIQLIAHPATMHGRAVRLTGFMHLEFEGDAVYLHGDDFANDVFKNGLWIDLNDKQRAAASIETQTVASRVAFSYRSDLRRRSPWECASFYLRHFDTHNRVISYALGVPARSDNVRSLDFDAYDGLDRLTGWPTHPMVFVKGT